MGLIHDQVLHFGRLVLSIGGLDLVPTLDHVVSGDLFDIERGTPLPQLLSLH